jgi:CheY-specific phosphatase CheX
MNATVIHLDHEIETVLKVVEQRTISFLRDELGLAVERLERKFRHEEHVVLRGMTAMVGVGSQVGLYIAYSYDESLIRAMTKRYTAELTVTPGEEDLYMRETASDVVNVIVGNCTADLAQRGGVITLSPPVLMLGARTIQARPKTTIATLTLQFGEGALDVAFVGPRLLFDDHLNYMGGISE